MQEVVAGTLVQADCTAFFTLPPLQPLRFKPVSVLHLLRRGGISSRVSRAVSRTANLIFRPTFVVDLVLPRHWVVADVLPHPTPKTS